MSQADLLWRWNPNPGALIPSRTHGPWTLAPSNGGGYHIIWRYDTVFARGGREMLQQIWEDVTC